MNRNNSGQLIAIFALIFSAVISRFIIHIPNFSPVLAIALFSGVYISNKKIAMLMPLAIMLLSDLFLGFHVSMIAVYLCYFAIVLIGIKINQNPGFVNVALSAIGGSVLFYLVTNFWFWLFGGMYPLTLSGLGDCYIRAIPFFRTGIAGDVVFTAAIFGVYGLYRRLALKPIPNLD